MARGGGLWVWTVNPDGTLGAMRQHRLKLDTGVSEAGALAFVRQTKVVVVGGDKVAVVGADSGYRSAVWRATDDTFYRGVATGARGRVFVYGDSADVTVLDDDLVTIGSFTVDADEVLDAALTPDGSRLIVGRRLGERHQLGRLQCTPSRAAAVRRRRRQRQRGHPRRHARGRHRTRERADNVGGWRLCDEPVHCQR